MAHSYLEYLRLKSVISTLRFFDWEAWTAASPSPDDSFGITCRDGKRIVKVNVYRPATPTTPSPVLVNWNGGAFVFSAHGTDEPFCRRVADRTAYTVLDASYALAPEHPFPAALEDAEDLIAHVLALPDEYDAKNVVLCGFSSGGNIALAAASGATQPTIPKDAIRAVVAFYPPTDMSIAPADKVPPGGTPLAVPPLLRTIMSAFRAAYLPPGVDPADPRISVVNAEPHRFPEKVLILTAGEDRLAPEAESLGEKLKGAGKEVVIRRFEGMRHGWDKAAEEGSEDARARDEAYDLVIKFLEDIRQ